MTKTNFSSILFDFDGTLSLIDGMDFLAELQGLTDELQAINATSRNTFSITSERYKQRLELLKPHRQQLEKLVEAYTKQLVPGAAQVCESLNRLGKELYIISGGIRNAIVPVGRALRIPSDHIFGVEVHFDSTGAYGGYDSTSPLTGVHGKKQIIRNLAPAPPVAFVGDGSNDLSARDTVDRFIGYGGAEYRPPIEEVCDVYITDRDFTAVLPEILTENELRLVEEHSIQH